jgi:hypothetical protein
VKSRTAEEMKMLEAKTYRQYAADCIRIAEKMGTKDKQVLLEIARAWEMRAEEAERREFKPDGKSDGHDIVADDGGS